MYPTTNQIEGSLRYRVSETHEIAEQPQPQPIIIINRNPNPIRNNNSTSYSHSLFNCCSAGCWVCCCSFCCGYSGVFADARTKYDGSNNCLNSCCIGSVGLRNIVREGYGITGNCCNDCMITTFCGPCAAIQTYAEVQERGPARQTM